MSRTVGLLAVCGALLCARALPAQSPSSLVAQDATDRFEFHSAFWVNLHHFLYAKARLARGLDTDRASVVPAAADTVGFGASQPAVQNDWNAALDWYSRELAGRDLVFDRGMNQINDALAATDEATTPKGGAIDSALSTALERAAPAYRSLWWSRDDRVNREWVVSISPLLRRHASGLAERIATIYATPWPAGLRVDLAAYASWGGAYTTNDPNHVTVGVRAEGNEGLGALETLFHEASHTLDRALDDQLHEAGRALGKRTPRALSHAVIFYTAGELIRRLDASYVPYAARFGLWSRVRGWERYRAIVTQAWTPHLDGTATLRASVERLAGLM